MPKPKRPYHRKYLGPKDGDLISSLDRAFKSAALTPLMQEMLHMLKSYQAMNKQKDIVDKELDVLIAKAEQSQ
jgi:hypothetical protein